MIATLNILPSFKINVGKNLYTSLLSLFEKNKIWNKLNEERLFRQKNKEMKKERLVNKKNILYATKSITN